VAFGAMGGVRVHRTLRRAIHYRGDPGAKIDALDKVLQDCRKAGMGTVVHTGSPEGATAFDAVETFSSGALNLDVALGGGWPRGRLVEIYGGEATGKSTLALHAIAEVQARGGTALLIDTEHAFNAIWARRIGVNVDALYLLHPETGESALTVVERFLLSGAIDLIVIDTVAMLSPEAELAKRFDQITIGALPTLMALALRRGMARLASESKCTIMFVNQIRMSIGPRGSVENTPGGKALKFAYSVRVQVQRKELLRQPKASTYHGLRVKATVIKNKLAPPFRSTEVDILFSGGVCKDSSVLRSADALGLLQRRGCWYFFGDSQLGQGKAKAVESLRNGPSMMLKLEECVREVARSPGKVLRLDQAEPKEVDVLDEAREMHTLLKSEDVEEGEGQKMQDVHELHCVEELEAVPQDAVVGHSVAWEQSSG